MPKRVYIWLPGQKIHGSIMDMPDLANVVNYIPDRSAKDYLTHVNNPYSAGPIGWVGEQQTLDIKKWKGNPVFWIAMRWDYSLGEGVVQPGAPSVLDMALLWPEIAGCVGESFTCPQCGDGALGVVQYEYWSITCTSGCNKTYTEQYLVAMKNPTAATIDTYRTKANNEFEGVEGLDPSLWEGTDLL